ncbi:gliding motility-associated ABC transporter substrate-binding protein GldG [Robertkochia sediminum]|uniref:gliding motility-associated ABC transporter substrate-binding protein GldG n=1 Tax=Robertkochia sediminum TaxID=2785326 RepID=UPI001933AD44|nr:gliding motility-associated ABC transporter substrate-binding protein GldG [Robertkochia sediminum]MBL7473079.1 gliding motility-associated ABC transporter substrate-binding protein GldG [Robertkochia sediminum]
MNSTLRKTSAIAVLVIVLLLVNYLAGLSGIRADLTKDQRYTLSKSAINAASELEDKVYVDVFLGGDLPAEFRKLRSETRQLLIEFQRENRNIYFNFIDPREDNEEETMANLQAMGLTPVSVTTGEGSKVSQELVFPWALVNNGARTVRVALMKNTLGATAEERVINSVQHLEYAFADAFVKVGITNKQKIAVLKGHGELDDIFIADFLASLGDYYDLAPFQLESNPENAEVILEQLKVFDLALVAKPSKAFSETDKLVLDQFTMNGGKSLWLVDKVAMTMDSLYKNQGEAIALPTDLNLDDMFFSYGVRINPALVSDLYFTQIVLATGSGTQTQYNPAPWLYHPMVFSKEDHAINTNIEAVRMQFANPIDTLKNGIRKEVLLTSSPLSKPVGAPAVVSLESVTQEPDKASFNQGGMPLAVLMEGAFTSVYRNRVKPVSLVEYKDSGKESAMIVIADGDLIRNDLQNGNPLELGYDKWTNNFYGNKEFLLNCVNYLLDESGLINIREKKVSLPFIDQQKAYDEKTRWQLVNIGIPAILTLLAGILFTYFRKRRYSR